MARRGVRQVPSDSLLATLAAKVDGETRIAMLSFTSIRPSQTCPSCGDAVNEMRCACAAKEARSENSIG